jgi:glycogen(starch) synthase
VKGFDLAIDAFAIVSDRHPDARMVIAGDGPERANLESRIAEKGRTGIIDMTGWVDPAQIPRLMQTASIVLIPSRDEGIPAVAREAGLAGRPVIATSVGGLPEVIEHERTGLLVEPESPSAIADAVSRLIQHPEQAAELGRKARSRISTMFSFERYVDGYNELYQRLTSAV